MSPPPSPPKPKPEIAVENKPPMPTELCIGGPLDGKQRPVRDATHFVVEPQGAPMGGTMGTVYRRRRLSVGNDEWIFVWTPENQTTRETLTLLLEHYAEGHRYA
jgi:hypothetical protein